jgi:hypothetical protein
MLFALQTTPEPKRYFSLMLRTHHSVLVLRERVSLVELFVNLEGVIDKNQIGFCGPFQHFCPHLIV